MRSTMQLCRLVLTPHSMSLDKFPRTPNGMTVDKFSAELQAGRARICELGHALGMRYCATCRVERLQFLYANPAYNTSHVCGLSRFTACNRLMCFVMRVTHTGVAVKHSLSGSADRHTTNCAQVLATDIPNKSCCKEKRSDIWSSRATTTWICFFSVCAF